MKVKYILSLFLLFLISPSCKDGGGDIGDLPDDGIIDTDKTNWVSVRVFENDDLEGRTFSVAGFGFTRDYTFLILNIYDRFTHFAYKFTGDYTGYTWTEDELITGTISDMTFVSPTHGYRMLAGNHNKLQKTTTAGLYWLDVCDIYLTQICFVDEKLGFAIDGSFSIYKTTNGGLTWETINVKIIFDTINFYNESLGFATSNGNVYRSVDGGLTWIKVYETFSAKLSKVHFVTDDIVLTGGENGSIFRSPDQGENWGREYNFSESEAASVLSFHFISRNVGFAAISNFGKLVKHTGGTLEAKGIILKTTDAGKEWKINYSSNTLRFTNIWFKDTLEGFAVGQYEYDNNNYAYITKTTTQGE